MTASAAWHGGVNFSAYADVEASWKDSTDSDVEAYRIERLRAYDPHVDFLRGDGRAALSVVDVGSGSSAFLYALARTGLLTRGVGIEMSPSRHAFAERWRVDGGFEQVVNVLGNFADTPIEPRSFDRFTVVDDTYLLLRPEADAYPTLLVEAAARALRPGGLFIAAFRNDAPLVETMPDDGRTFWRELPPSNGFKYALYRQEPSPDRRLLRNESIYIRRDLTEMRKVEITEVCDVEALLAELRGQGFGTAAAFDGFSDRPFDPVASQHVVVVAER